MGGGEEGMMDGEGEGGRHMVRRRERQKGRMSYNDTITQFSHTAGCPTEFHVTL